MKSIETSLAVVNTQGLKSCTDDICGQRAIFIKEKGTK